MVGNAKNADRQLYQQIRTLVTKHDLFPDYTSFDLTDDLIRLFYRYAEERTR